MARITVNMGNFKVDELELEPGTLNIGRNHDNHLHIDDPTVSNHHAKIVSVFNSSYVEDLGSTNGTFINGQKTKTHTLHNGDVLTIGRYQILFQSELTAMQELNATMMIGVNLLEKLTQEAKQKKYITPEKTHAVHQPSQKQAIPEPGEHLPQAANKPPLKLHENTTAPITKDNMPPDINNTVLLGPKSHPTLILPEQNISPASLRKIIALAVLAAITTFILLTVFFT